MGGCCTQLKLDGIFSVLPDGLAGPSPVSLHASSTVDCEFLWLIHLAVYGPGDVGLVSTEVETPQVFSSAEEGALRARTQGHFVRK